MQGNRLMSVARCDVLLLASPFGRWSSEPVRRGGQVSGEAWRFPTTLSLPPAARLLHCQRLSHNTLHSRSPRSLSTPSTLLSSPLLSTAFRVVLL
jgi:hypothetical protein